MTAPAMDNTFSVLWQIAQNATPVTTMLFMVMYWLERQERRELRKERDALLERVLAAMSEMRTVLRDIVRG
jgi:hypothetical protein